jgi:hypothetical protein
MTGKAAAAAGEVEILKDLVREADVQKKIGLTSAEAESGLWKENYRKYPANTSVRVYPYTEPLLIARSTEHATDQGFKEAWSAQKVNSERERMIAKSLKQVSGRQCFSFEISSDNRDATETKYWSATLRQDGADQNLAFSKGDGFIEETKTLSSVTNPVGNMTTGTVRTNRKYYFFAEACAAAPINLLQSFSIELEPRFQRNLLPLRLDWLATKKTKI